MNGLDSYRRNSSLRSYLKIDEDCPVMLEYSGVFFFCPHCGILATDPVHPMAKGIMPIKEEAVA